MIMMLKMTMMIKLPSTSRIQFLKEHSLEVKESKEMNLKDNKMA